ncbi:MAG TPA: NAD-dependent epimerase/dehydratase family protein [Verrucomicrobiae bacterium]|jgi:GDP-L-fucose synthase
MSRFLVTGAKGFIGKNLTRFLREKFGEEGVVSAGREFDLREPARARELFANFGAFDYIVHLADVQGNAQWSARNAADQFLANAKISLNVLEAWRLSQPRARLICMSSLWAYPERIAEAAEADYWNGRLHQATEHYGLNKKLLGVGLEAHKRQHGMKGTSLVLGSVYGPEDATTHVIPSLLARMRQNPDRLEIWGDGTETRDFIYVDDQVRGIFEHRDYNGELLNISSGKTYSIREAVDILARLMDYKGEIVFDVSKASGTASRRINVALAGQTTGWPAQFKLHTLEEGLQKTVNSYKKTNA